MRPIQRYSLGLLFCLIILLLAIGASAQEGTDGGGEEEVDSETCLECHADKDLEAETKRGKSLNLFMDHESLVGSVHEDLECLDCHTGAKDWEDAPHNDGKACNYKCGECHEKALDEYQHICVHGKEHAAGNKKAPWCHQCHGGHKIVPLESEKSVLSPTNQPETCGKCHRSDNVSPEGHIAKRKLIERYYSSVHWQSVKEGKPAASCSDCHGTHCVLPSSEKGSHVSRIGSLTSCAVCHKSIVSVYSKGSHGRTLLNGNLDVPTCVTCHGDHDMTSLKTQSGGTRNFAGTQICIWCHGNERMMSRYALDTSPVESYMRDFHGLTQRGTAGTSATCADCHDPHHSLPSSHPESRMHLSNRGTTCGKCHGQKSGSFILSFTHRTVAVEQGGDVKSIVTWIYVLLIIAVIGFMLLHNLLIWIHSIRRKKLYQAAHGHIVRLNRFERIWHWALLLSFLVLVFTGFALVAPNSWVFSWLYSFGLTEGARSWIHRLAAVVMTASLLSLGLYQLVSKTGRVKWFFGMLPRLRDIKELFGSLAYYLGRRKDKPRSAVFSYVEKAEYWALIWGTVIMLVTGVVLWFPGVVPDGWPAWLIEVAKIIHLYEAILASLAILVWHFFHTILHPGEYPMDTSWLTGVMTEEEARHRFDDEAIAAQLPPPEKEQPVPEAPHTPEWSKDPEHKPAPEADAGDKAQEQKSEADSDEKTEKKSDK